jgi:hypothetical protein
MDSLPPLKFDDSPTTDALPPLEFEDSLPELKFEDDKPGILESSGRAAIQGLTFDMADNAQALAEAVKAKSAGDTRPLKAVYLEKLAPIEAKYEEARAAHPVASTIAGVAGGVALPGVGWLKGGKTLGAAIKAGVAGGALAGAGSTSMADLGETALGAAKGAAIGGTIGAGMHGVYRAVPALQSAFKDFPLGKRDSGVNYHEQYQQVLDKVKARPTKTFSDITRASKGNDPVFTNWFFEKANVPPKERTAIKFRDLFEQYNADKRQGLFEDFIDNQQQSKAMRLLTNRISNELGGGPKEALDGFMTAVRPTTYTAMRVDTKAPTNFTGAIMELIEAENRWGADAAPWMSYIENLKKRVMASNPKFSSNLDEWNNEIVSKLESGNMDDDVVTDIVSFFESARPYLNEKYGLNIQKLKNDKGFYIPKSMLNKSDIRIKLDRGLDALERGTMDTKEAEHFFKALDFLSKEYGIPVDTGNVKNIRKFINDDIMSNKVQTARFSLPEASAAFKRENDIPPYLLEKDVFKLMSNYITNNMKAGLFAQPLSKLETEIEKSRLLGMNTTAKYFEGLRDHLTGIPSLYIANRRKNMADIKLHGDRMIRDGIERGNKLAITLGNIEKTLPDFVPFAMSNMYKNLLALNPYAVVRQFAQVPTLGVPDIGKNTGITFASRVTGEALLRGVEEGGLAGVNDYLRRVGQFKAGPSEDLLFRGIYDGLVEAGLPKSVVRAIGGYERATNQAMKLYGGADAINRFWSGKTADVMTDYMFGTNEALKAKVFKYISDMPPAYQKHIRDLHSAGNKAEVGRMMRNYIIPKHQYSYTTTDLNKLGREFGTLLTAFTKFPMSTLADIGQEMYKHGKIGGMAPVSAKYLLPLGLLMAADYAAKETELRKDPLAKLLIGTRFTDLSPVLGMMVQPPPVVTVPYKIGETLVEGAKELQDPRKVAKKVVKEASPFIPAYGLYDYTKRRLERADIIKKDKE